MALRVGDIAAENYVQQTKKQNTAAGTGERGVIGTDDIADSFCRKCGKDHGDDRNGKKRWNIDDDIR